MEKYHLYSLGFTDLEDTLETWKLVEDVLNNVLKEGTYIITTDNRMYPIEGLVIKDGHRGPMLQNPDLTYDWWYNIEGYAKLEE